VNQIKLATFAFSAVVAAAGCGIGNAPEPMSASDVKDQVDQLPVEQQIEWIQRSPLPPEEKQKRIDEIRAKAGGGGGGGQASQIPGGPNIPN
jgi:hypothetical protein